MSDPAVQPPISNDEAMKLCKPPPLETKDPKKSLQFYTEVLGMTLLQKMDFPSMKFSVYFLGYEDPATRPGDLGTPQRTEWALSRKATIELTQYVSRKLAMDLWTNWGTENDDHCKYHNGNSDPRGFGNIGIMVPDVYKACDRFEQLGVNFVKKPDDGKMKGLAFITDPDGYWIEIYNNKTSANL